MQLAKKLIAGVQSAKLFAFPNYKGKGGGVSSVSSAAITKYCNFLERKRKAAPSQWIREVQDLSATINSDPVIRMCLQGTLDTLSQTHAGSQVKPPLYGYSIEQVLDAINTVAITPPQYANEQIIGVPFSILFFGIMNSYFGQGFFANPKVNTHLKQIFNIYGTMLHSLKSRDVLDATNNGWLSSDKVDYNDFIHDSSDPRFFGFQNWNDWFVRRLAPDARPVDQNQNVIVHSSDSYCLQSPYQPVRNVQATNSFWLKDDNYSLFDMFGVQQMGPQIKSIVQNSFVNGTVYQAFLSPWCYHRWHAPVAGKLLKSYKLPGTYLLSNPMSDFSNSGEDNYVGTQPLLTSLSVRQIYIIDSERTDIGKIGLIQIGMGQVSSCISTVNEGDRLSKGQQLGRFEFGGSSYAMIFDKAANLKFSSILHNLDENGDPILQRVNSALCQVVPPLKKKK